MQKSSGTKSIGEFKGRSYNLNLLKFIAAVLVVFSHAYGITGHGDDPMMWLSRGQMSFGGFAVAIFFFASGFYVTKSLLAKKTGKQYFKARIERLYPAFFVALFLTAFVLGPIVSDCSVGTYFTSAQTYTYFLYLLMIPKYTLPGVFAHNPVQFIVNASLWTMVLEVICYIGLFVAYKLHLLEKKNLKKINILVLLAIAVVFGVKPQMIYQFHTYLRPLFIFIIGMEMYVFRDSIRMDWKWGLGCLVLAVPLFALGYSDLFMISGFVYLLSLVVFSQKQISEKIGKLGNYSYAMYLTAFPIQQTLVCYMPGMSVLANTALTFVINVLAAALIYHLVEVPCTKWLSKK